MSVSLACRVLCIACIRVVLAAPEKCSMPDEAALFQKDVQAHSALSQPLADQKQHQIAKALAEAYQTYTLMAQTAAASAKPPQLPIDILPGNMTMDEIMKIATDVLKAFENDAFFAAVKDTVKAVTKSFVNFTQFSQGQLDLAANALQTSTDEQLLLRLKQFSLKQGDALMEVARIGLSNVLNVVDKIPAGNLKDMAVEGTKGASHELEGHGDDFKNMIGDLYGHNGTRFCNDVKAFWLGYLNTEKEVRTNILPSFNKTTAQVSQIEPMIQSFAPKVADKLMGLLNEAVDDAYFMLSSAAPVLHNSAEVFAEAFEKNLGCSFQSAGSRRGPGALAGLAALAAGLWAGAR